MIKLHIYCPVLIIGDVEVGPDIGMKFHQEVMEIVSYDNEIKKLLVSLPVLKAPTPDGLFRLKSDTLREGVGSTLLQK